MNTKPEHHKLFNVFFHVYRGEDMSNSKFNAALIVMILSAILLIVPAIAPLTSNYTIHSSGSISTPRPVASYETESELRAIFVHGMSMINPDWNTIAATVKSYNINTLVLEVLYPHGSRYPSKYVPSYTSDMLTPGIAAAHSRGMQIYASVDTLLGALNDTMKIVAYDGTLMDWTDPTNPVSLNHLKNLIQELATFNAPDTIDGIMFDYIRYDTATVPYGPYAKQELEAYLGENITNWPGDFAPGGTRYSEFMEWRVTVIDNLVKNLREWALEVNPKLKFTAAVWGWEPTNPTYNRYWIGQDFVKWVKEGWLDWVSPMMYTTDLNRLIAFMNDYNAYGTGGPEGKIPLVPFLTNSFPSTVNTTNFAQQIATIRAHGADGWAIWRYGGPGDGQGSGAPDIRNYLNLINLPPVFTMGNITVSGNTINWITTLPATSTVEYNTSPLFNATFKFSTITNFHYWVINHIAGTIINDTTPVVNHSITLTGLQSGTLYYYRVQSQDSSGIATSEVYTFRP
jgi:uncharacterized lipoprotein YddW (UPF0748 family)